MDAAELHVLVVEDNPGDRELIRRGLDQLGVDCTTYEHGDHAVATYNRYNYDGIILDQHSSDGNFVHEVRLSNKTHIPIMLYSKCDEPQSSALGVAVSSEADLHNTLYDFVELLKDKK